jgi:hypothetical protein
MAGIASKKNGLLGGRPKGRKSNKTLEREAAAKVFGDMVRQTMKPLFHSQLSIAHGVSFVYRIDRHKRKGEPVRIEHVLLGFSPHRGKVIEIVIGLTLAVVAPPAPGRT